MILPKTRSLFSIVAQKFPIFLVSSVIFYLLSFIFYLPAAHAVPNDGTYYLQANTESGGAGTSVSSTDYKVTNFTIGETVGGKPKGSDTASVCEAGGSGICKVNPGWLFTRTKFAGSGNFSSTDFLTGESSTSIDTFTYKLTALPSGTSGTVQFSQDGTAWYNSSGAQNGTDALNSGTNTISLTALGWTNSKFYYKVAFAGPGNKTLALDNVVLGFGGSAARIRPIFTLVTTDGQNDYLQYKIKLCTDSALTLNCQTFDQSASQTGWSGQDSTGSTAYKSGSQAYYSIQSDLTVGTTYYWQAWAKDPAGTNAWSTASSVVSFTTTTPPNTPTISAPTHKSTGVSRTPAIVLSATDPTNDYIRYKIKIATDIAFTQNLQTFDQTVSQTGWSGQNTQTNTAYTSGGTATYTVQSSLLEGKRYFVQAYAKDPGGSNIWSAASSIIFFLTAGVTPGPCTSQPGGDFNIDENCTYTGSSEGVDAGNLTIKTGSTFTLNANQSIVWNPGQSITIQPGASIAINSSSKLTQNYMYTPSSGTSGYPDPIGFAGALAVYHMDDALGNTGTSGTTISDSGGSNSATAVGTLIVSGKLGNARSLNGSSDYITAPAKLTPTGVKTVAFWLKTTASTNQVVLDNSGNSSAGNGVTFDINSTAGKIRASLAKGTGGTYNFQITGNKTINDDSWHHVALTWDGTSGTNKAVLYIDGCSAGSTYCTGYGGMGTVASATDNTPTNNLRLGAVSGGSPATYFNGSLDEVQIFNRALSQMEITGLFYPSSGGMQFMYQNTNPDSGSYRRRKDISSAAAPIGEWKLNEQSGTGAYILNTAP